MFKQFTAAVLALCLVLCLTVPISAQERVSGTCGDDAWWSLENGTLTISGTGEVYDSWTIDNEEWFAVRDQVTRAVVEDGITYIGSHTFGWCRNLSSVTLSDTVSDIGGAAFFYCEALESIDLPDGLNAIGDNAFAHSGLKTVEIPAGVTFLGANAFGNCEELTDVLICSNPDLPGMTTGNSVFHSCDSLPAIQVEEGHFCLRSIDGALYIEDWDGTRRLNSYPAGREQTTFRLADNTVSVEQYAFRGAKRLEQVTIPATVASIGSGTFMDVTSLTQVTFEGSAPEFGNDVFTRCTAVTVRYPQGDASWTADVMQNYGGTVTWESWDPNANKCGDNARWSYANGTLTIYGSGAVQDYRVLVNDQDVQYAKPWDEFSQDIRHIVIEEGITRLGNDAFVNLSKLESVVLPDTLTEIGNFVFCGCASLSDVELPEGLTALGQQSFWSCTSLKSIEIPASLTFVDANVFEDCTALTDVYFRSDPDLPGFVMGNSVFKNCTALQEIRVEDGHMGLKSIDGALYFYWWDSGNMVLNSYPAGRQNADLRIADSTVRIEQSALYGNPWLENVVIPDTVTLIGSNAFAQSTNLQTVKFKGSAPDIQSNVFWGTHVTIYYPEGNSSWDNREQWSDEYLVGWQGSVQWESYDARNPFTDVDPVNYASFYDAILWAVENGITTGTTATTFSPSADCLRAAVVTFLWRAADCPEPVSMVSPFTDVTDPNAFYYKAVLWAVEEGITNGMGDGTFGVFEPCSRAQVVTFLYRAMNSPEVSSDVSGWFSDVTDAAMFYYAPVAWAVEEGITNGLGDGTFGVNKTCNRAQIVTFLYRAYYNANDN